MGMVRDGMLCPRAPQIVYSSAVLIPVSRIAPLRNVPRNRRLAVPEQEFPPSRRPARSYRPDRDDDDPPPWANMPPVGPAPTARPSGGGYPGGPGRPGVPAGRPGVPVPAAVRPARRHGRPRCPGAAGGSGRHGRPESPGGPGGYGGSGSHRRPSGPEFPVTPRFRPDPPPPPAPRRPASRPTAATTRRCHRGPSGRNPSQTARMTCRRPGRVSRASGVPAGPCGPRRAGGGGGS